MYALVALIFSGDLDVLALFMGFFGGLLLTLFGVPPIGVLNTGMYVGIETTWQLRIAAMISRLGLALVSASFLLQLYLKIP